jgi:muconolactone D-isomerase
MEFLVRIEVHLPPEMPSDERQSLIDAERRRGRELQEAGMLHRIWRVPGRWANVAIYRAPDATNLHEALSSLPLWPWMTVSVEALAVHPLEADLGAR